MSKIDRFLKAITIKQFLFGVGGLVFVAFMGMLWLYFSDNETFSQMLEIASQPLLG